MIGWPRIDDYPGPDEVERPPLSYRWFGWWVRWQACKLAAQAISGPHMAGVENKGTMLWSFTVFFEHYMHNGAAGSQADFGPKEPVDLKVIRSPVMIPVGMQSPIQKAIT